MPSELSQFESLVATLQADVARLRVKDEIGTLLNTYGHALDSGSYDTYESLFTETCVVGMSFGTHEGKDGLGWWMKEALNGVERSVHLITNVEVEDTGDWAEATRAKARAKLHGACWSNVLTLGGMYDWEFERADVDSRWLITSVKLDTYWSRGDASLLEGKQD
ncbi:hypothetical protein MNV49_007084 [Pseudohyphozyma bogoriensis]|nr:hypothetical protein MNV49_007084 [Pseudohyphozyma bogoriensis]